MTALNEFDRLESTGVWRATPDKQRRDVIVSLGNATLVISDQQDVALTHWSLPAVERTNPGERPALFSPGPDATDTLELNDEVMIRAIGKVKSAIKRRRAHPGRLRNLLVGGGVILVTALALFWLPGAMVRHTAAVVPPATRLLIGHTLLDNIRRVSGAPCSTPQGDNALSVVHRRLLGTKFGNITVLSGGVQKSQHLPGGIIILNRGIIEDYEDPEVAAGFILAEDQRAIQSDPLLRMLQDTGLMSAFKLLTTGQIPDKALDTYGELLLTQTPEELDIDQLLGRFSQAKVRSSPYAYAIDVSGETTIGLIEADPVSTASAQPVLSDGEWVALQGICGE